VSGGTQRQQTYDYNQRLQPDRIQLGTAADNDANSCVVYNYYGGGNPTSCTLPTPGSSNNGNLRGYWYSDVTNSSQSHTSSFTMDALNRLTDSDATGNQTQSLDFSYDRYGNMTCTTQGLCTALTFSTSTNHITTGSYPYDAAGNLLTDGTHSYQWDAKSRLEILSNGRF
jgi:YD repeat-containing protein